VGEGVSHLQPGDAVLGVTRFGGYQGGVCIDADRVRRIPEAWDMVTAAAFPTAMLTAAYGLLEMGRLRAGEVVVIHSAAGGVGSTAVQIAHAMGAVVVGTVGSDQKLPVLEALGCRMAMNYKTTDWAGRVQDELGGADLVFDALGGQYLKDGYSLLNPNGRLVSYGLGTMTPAGGRPNWFKLAWQFIRLPRFSIFPMISDVRSVGGFNVLLLWDRLDLLGPLLDRGLQWAAQGKLKPDVSQVVHFSQAGLLHERMQSGNTTGKLVLRFQEE
jgi:NADPH:quinone reductase-like Zn-dependent oxidoreductase